MIAGRPLRVVIAVVLLAAIGVAALLGAVVPTYFSSDLDGVLFVGLES